MAKLEPPYETYVDQIIEYKEKVLTVSPKRLWLYWRIIPR